jgi:hypothetical protein
MRERERVQLQRTDGDEFGRTGVSDRIIGRCTQSLGNSERGCCWTTLNGGGTGDNDKGDGLWTDRSLRSDHRTVHTGARKQRTRSLEGTKGVRGRVRGGRKQIGCCRWGQWGVLSHWHGGGNSCNGSDEEAVQN